MNPLHHPGAHQIPDSDIEKQGDIESAKTTEIANSGSETFPDAANNASSSSCDSSKQNHIPPSPVLKGRLASWNARVESLAGLEARGITRVLPEEKHHGGGRSGYLQMLALWLSINLVANNIITGLLGPLVFDLGWVDSVCIVIFATGLSACGAGYIATFGPQSGNRTMVCMQENEFFSSIGPRIFEVVHEFYLALMYILLIYVACFKDRGSICHGLLALKNCLCPQSHYADGLGNHRMHHRRPDAFGDQRRRHEYRRWLCC